MIHGLVLSRPLGDVVSEQTPSQAVKNLQNVIKAIAAATGKQDRYGITTADGQVGPRTTSALILIVRDGVAQIPVLSDIIDKFLSAPGVSLASGCLNNRTGACSIQTAWDLLIVNQPAWLRDNVINPIRNGAQSINSVLAPIAEQLSTGGAGATPMSVFIPPGIQPGGYPPGTVAIRDPALGQYRLIVPT